MVLLLQSMIKNITLLFYLHPQHRIIAHNEVGLDRGSLFKWNDEFWIILQKMFRPEQPGFNGYAYRCTGELKWIDKDGNLQIRPGYISSGRTTNSLTYTPDVNYKFENILNFLFSSIVS